MIFSENQVVWQVDINEFLPQKKPSGFADRAGQERSGSLQRASHETGASLIKRFLAQCA